MTIVRARISCDSTYPLLRGSVSSGRLHACLAGHSWARALSGWWRGSARGRASWSTPCGCSYELLKLSPPPPFSPSGSGVCFVCDLRPVHCCTMRHILFCACTFSALTSALHGEAGVLKLDIMGSADDVSKSIFGVGVAHERDTTEHGLGPRKLTGEGSACQGSAVSEEASVTIEEYTLQGTFTCGQTLNTLSPAAGSTRHSTIECPDAGTSIADVLENKGGNVTKDVGEQNSYTVALLSMPPDREKQIYYKCKLNNDKSCVVTVKLPAAPPTRKCVECNLRPYPELLVLRCGQSFSPQRNSP